MSDIRFGIRTVRAARWSAGRGPSERVLPCLRDVARHGPVVAVVAAATLQVQAPAAARVTTPQQQFGHEIGADYVLPNYTQLTGVLEEARSRVRSDAARRASARPPKAAPQLMAIITSPENFKKLDRYKEISRRLALAEGLTDDQARALAAEGKAVVWIDGGLHATEVLGAQQLMELVYQMVSRNDPETLRILNDVILLAVHANPDGMELVVQLVHARADTDEAIDAPAIPRLYQKYIGHDNNRDFYMRQPARDDQHEPGAVPRVVSADRVQPSPDRARPARCSSRRRSAIRSTTTSIRSIPLGIDLVGAAMHSRFAAEGKPGATMRRGANYSTWWNGGLRTTAYFHNMIGLLTETIGNPTPIEIPFVPQRQLPTRRSAVSDRAADVAFPAVDRVLDHRQSRRARPRLALSRDSSSSTSTAWGGTRSSAAAATPGRSRRSASTRCRRPSPRIGAGRGAGRSNPAASRRRIRHAGRRASTSTCCAIPRTAIRAATSFPPTSRIS